HTARWPLGAGRCRCCADLVLRGRRLLFVVPAAPGGADGIEVDAAPPRLLPVPGGPLDRAAHAVLVGDHAGGLTGLFLLVVRRAQSVAVVERGLPTLGPGHDVVELADARVAVRGTPGLMRVSQEAGERRWELPGT